MAIGATLSAFARLNYFLFPSLYSEWFYTGDVLRLGFFLALLMGGLAEIRLAQRALTGAAVLEERRRLARDLHDGMAQDLAFIIQTGRRLCERPGAPPGLRLMITAAEGALDDSRHAITALVRPVDEPILQAIERTATEAAARGGAAVSFDAPVDVEVSEATQETLLRVVREAVTNAVRHGHAKQVMREASGLSLSIRDDGSGFDVVAARSEPGHLGLTSMRERVMGIGGDLRVTSALGEGSRVEVLLP